jgi:NAD(P)-dependent dehydrogenase (short-subunit alcohol dehydrogenase family)
MRVTGLGGKVALVTGGGTGIGAAVASRFRDEGADVVIMGRRAEPLDEVAGRTGAVAVAGDAADPKAVQRAVRTAVDRFGGLDVVVANAGGGGRGDALSSTYDAWHSALHGNLDTAFVTVRESLPQLLDRAGAVVIVSSLAAVAAGPESVGYTTAKHALTGLTRSLARDFSPRGVRVNAVCPGWVRSDMGDRAMRFVAATHGVDIEGAYTLATRDVPLRRPGTADEVASICLFLATPESSLITGAIVMADGGAHVVDVPTLALQRPVTTEERSS